MAMVGITLINMKKCFAILAISSPLLFTSCGRYASEKDFDVISLNMDKQDVIEKMSARGVARGSIINKHGQQIEVREYEVRAFRPFSEPRVDYYWLYFCDNKLVQWGKAGDWAEAQRMVYDVNFNIHK